MNLTEEQEKIINQAIHWFHKDSNQIFEISGYAGTGKSVVLYEIVRRLRLQENQYMAMAYTGAAAIVMRMKGFPYAKSIHSSLYHTIEIEVDARKDKYNKSGMNTQFNTKQKEYKFIPLRPEEIPRSVKLFVIDEGFMVPYYMRRVILQHGIKVLVCGDMNQLPPVGDVGSAFFNGSGIHFLTQIIRQNSDNSILYLADRARRGLPIHCGMYGRNALVITRDELTTDMIMSVGNVICGTNKTRDSINAQVRHLLGRDAPTIGDRVICRENDWNIEMGGIALANGLQGYITSPVDASSFNPDGTFRMNFLPDLLNQPFENLDVNYRYITSPYDQRNQIKKAWYTRGELFEYAYAITTHLSQGSEYPAGIYIEESLGRNSRNALLYTGITRFKQYMIYVKPSMNSY